METDPIPGYDATSSTNFAFTGGGGVGVSSDGNGKSDGGDDDRGGAGNNAERREGGTGLGVGGRVLKLRFRIPGPVESAVM